jgi:CRP-like cAMP-binding protein
MTLTSCLPVYNCNRSEDFSRRDIIPHQNDLMWEIESGLVRTLTWLEDGTTITLGWWGKGDVISPILSGCDPYQIECLSKVTAKQISLQQDYLQEILFKYIYQTEELTIIRGHKRLDIMLYHLLNWLSKKFGLSVEKGQMIDLRFTHQDLAELMGTTRVTVTKLLQQFEQQGLINRLNQHKILLPEANFCRYEI